MTASADGIRIDKWLWATRVFKTRPKATQACQSEHVKIAGNHVKPSRAVRAGDIVEVRWPDLLKTVRVKDVTPKRVSPKQVDDFLEDLTPASEYERQKNYWRGNIAQRERGSGRPTKRERRETDRFFRL